MLPTHIVAVAYAIPFLTLVLVFTLRFFDARRKRSPDSYHPFISFILSAYNDNDSVSGAVRSIYASYDHFELFVINDKSTDGSEATLRSLAKELHFTLIENPINLGKTKSINLVAEKTRGEIIFVVDADIVLTPEAVADVLERFNSRERVAAVSCPYKPKNTGLLPPMQSVEYNVIKMTKYAQNLTSVLGLWGGALAVKREPFFAVSKFSENALIEDVDLALKLYKNGYRIEQSSVPVDTYVPTSFRALVKQKIRWSSGGAQCFFTYPTLFFKNPLQLIFSASHFLLTVSFLYYFSGYVTFIIHLSDRFLTFVHPVQSFVNLFRYIWFIDREVILRGVFIKFGLMTFTVPYVFMLIRSSREWYKMFYIIPYTFLYSPVYAFIYFYGWGRGVKKYFELRNTNERAW